MGIGGDRSIDSLYHQLRFPSSFSVTSLPRLLRKYFLPDVSPPWPSAAKSPSLDAIRPNPPRVSTPARENERGRGNRAGDGEVRVSIYLDDSQTSYIHALDGYSDSLEPVMEEPDR